MRRLVLLLLTLSGCTCGRKPDLGPVPAASSSTSSPDLVLQRDALVAFGNSVPLPVSPEFTESVPSALPALERAAKAHPDGPMPMRVARDAPYGQLARIVTLATTFRVGAWQLFAEDATGAARSIKIAAPGILRTDRCFARLWVGPEGVVHVGFDPGTGSGLTAVVVRPRDGAPQTAKAIDVVRRLDESCTTGQLRLYTQPTAPFGPLFDLAYQAAEHPAKVGDLMLGGPSVGPLDKPSEVVP